MNILILDDDFSFSNSLKIELLKSKKIENVDSFDTFPDFINSPKASSSYDVIFLDVDFMQNNLDSFFNIVGKTEIIALSKNFKFISKNINSSVFQRIFKKPILITDLISYLNKHYKLYVKFSKAILTKSSIFGKLSELGFNPGHLGTDYLAQSIWLALNDEIKKTKEIYKIVAENNYKTVTSVNWAMYNCIDYAYGKDKEGKINTFFKIYDGRKPTPKFIINYFATIVNK